MSQSEMAQAENDVELLLEQSLLDGSEIDGLKAELTQLRADFAQAVAGLAAARQEVEWVKDGCSSCVNIMDHVKSVGRREREAAEWRQRAERVYDEVCGFAVWVGMQWEDAREDGSLCRTACANIMDHVRALGRARRAEEREADLLRGQETLIAERDGYLAQLRRAEAERDAARMELEVERLANAGERKARQMRAQEDAT